MIIIPVHGVPEPAVSGIQSALTMRLLNMVNGGRNRLAANPVPSISQHVHFLTPCADALSEMPTI